MATKPIKPNTVNLDGTNYVIEGAVQRELASQFPQKIVTGDYSEESHPFVSTITWDDFSGGILKETGDFPRDINRSYFSTLNTRHKGHLFLNPQHGTQTMWLEVNAGAPIQAKALGGNLEGALVATSTNTVENVQSVGTIVFQTSSAQTSDLVTGRINGILVYASTDSDKGVSVGRNSGGAATFNDSLFKPTKIAIWRDLLWGITDSGSLRFADNAEAGSTVLNWTEVSLTDLGLKAQGLLVGPDKNLYAIGTNGLHLYDNQTETFETVFDFGGNSSVSGKAFDVWQGSIYVTDRMEIFQYTPGSITGGLNVVTNMGFEREDGLPRDRQGVITALGHTNRALYANIKAEDTTKYSAVYEWNGAAWQTLTYATTTTPARDGGAMFLGKVNAGSNKAFDGIALTPGWMNSTGGLSSRMASVSLKQTAIIPSQADTGNIGTYNRSASSQNFLITPWVRTDGNQQWNALEVSLDHSFFTLAGTTTDSDKITVDYGIDWASSFLSLGTITGVADSNGTSTFTLPRGSTDPEGLPFRAFRVRVGMQNDGGLTPDIHRITLSYSKNLDPLWGFRFIIDTTNQQFGSSPKEVRETLKALFSKKTLFNFTFKGDAGERESYMVKPIALQSLEQTGSDESGRYALTVVEVN